MAETYQFKPSEYPFVPGSPYTPEHPASRRLAYALVGILAGLTGGLGNSLVTANLAHFQGTLGLTAVETAWIPAAYVMTNVCANLVLVKFRQQFGLGLFVQLVLAAYFATALAHLFIHGFWSAILVRAASGIAGAGLMAISVLSLFQAMPAHKRIGAILIGISIPQLSAPLARVIAPSLLEWGDWRMSYFFEVGLVLLTLAAVLTLPLPPGRHERAFERTDLLTIGLIFPGVVLLCAVLGLGRVLWWTEAEWLGYALIGAVLLLVSGFAIEHRRSRPLLATRWLGQWTIIRIALVAIFVRVLLTEQSFGAIGLLTAVGMGIDQIQPLYVVVSLASLAGLVAAVLMFRPGAPARPIQLACLLIAIGAFMDAGSTNLTRPHNLYLSQALIGFGALLFIGPAMVIGVSRTLLAGRENFISWLVLFGATQNLGALAGTAAFGTFQTVREKFHSHGLVEQLLATNPLVADRLAAGARQLGSSVSDPLLRGAESIVLLGRQVSREAHILAFNDVFLVIAILACAMFLWAVSIEFRLRRARVEFPTILLTRKMAAMASAGSSQGQSA